MTENGVTQKQFYIGLREQDKRAELRHDNVMSLINTLAPKKEVEKNEERIEKLESSNKRWATANALLAGITTVLINLGLRK